MRYDPSLVEHFSNLSRSQRKALLGAAFDVAMSDGELAEEEVAQIYRLGWALGFNKNFCLKTMVRSIDQIETNPEERQAFLAIQFRGMPRKDVAIMVAIALSVLIDGKVMQEERKMAHDYGELLGFAKDEVDRIMQVCGEGPEVTPDLESLKGLLTALQLDGQAS